MASWLEDDLSCPICQEVFRDPVLLSCSHSFCRTCVETWWKDKPAPTCPVCKRRSSVSQPPCLVLKNLCETFIEQRGQRSERLCSLHGEKISLFCLDHQDLLCLVCRDSEKHQGHRFRPIDEAAQESRKNLQRTLEPLKKKLVDLQKVWVDFDQTVEHIQVQARCTETQIQEQFKKFHRFLEEEEEARMAALKVEEEQKIQIIREKMEVLNREMAALMDSIMASEDLLRTGDLSFLRNYRTAEDTPQQRLPLDHTQLFSGALIDQAKHLGNLTYTIWNKMKDMVTYSPVVLDPNTAHPKLLLSEDLTRVTGENKQDLPDNPERFDQCYCVLGSEGFQSGTHSWDVEVGDSTWWMLGVLESVQRKGQIRSGLWAMAFKDHSYVAWSTRDLPQVLYLEKVRRVRVLLDCDGGKLTFSNADTNSHLHTFDHAFNREVFPYINTGDQRVPLRMVPLTVSVSKELGC